MSGCKERAGKKGWWKVCTQTRQWLCHSSMTVWWLVTLLAWWWLQCVVEWMWNAREFGDAHKRLIAPRWSERKERSTVFGEPHPPIQTHTHSSTCLVCATIATTCVCPLFGCALWCVSQEAWLNQNTKHSSSILVMKGLRHNQHCLHDTQMDC